MDRVKPAKEERAPLPTKPNQHYFSVAGDRCGCNPVCCGLQRVVRHYEPPESSRSEDSNQNMYDDEQARSHGWVGPGCGELVIESINTVPRTSKVSKRG
jgi:hypothetical protein